jgi:hypothetical protein
VPKPKVSVREGFLVATADKAIRGGTAQVRTVARTGAVTPLGELVLVRVEKPGTLLLAGVRHKTDVRAVVDLMFRHRAEKVLIDGSYQRIMAADPDVTQGAILATGAILGRSVREVVRRTQTILDRLLVPVCPDPSDLGLLGDAVRHDRPAVRDSTGRIVVMAEAGSAVREESLQGILGGGDAVIAMPGAVTDRLVRALIAHRGGRVRLIANDPTRMFVSAPLLTKFRERQGELFVGHGVRLLAIAVNPVSVLGHELPEDALAEGIRAVAPGVPVFSFREPAGQ